MVMFKKIIFTAVLFLCSGLSFSATYDFSAGTAAHYPSATTACQGALSYYSTYSFTSITYVSDSQWHCNYRWSGDGQLHQFSSDVLRFGSSCPSGTEYDGQDGVCATPCTVSGQVHAGATGACTCPAGQSVYNGACAVNCTYDSNTTELVTVSGAAGRASDSANQCSNTCGFVLVGIVSIAGGNCTINSNGTSTCSYWAKGTGQRCGGGTTAAVSSSPIASATQSNSTTNTTTTQSKPAGTVPTQSGTTVATTQSSQDTANTNGTITTTTTTTTTQTNPDGSQVITTVTGSVVKPGTTGSGTGTGGGTGTGIGTGTGSAGQCDPTESDYITCLAGNQTATTHTAGTAATFGDALTNFQTQMKTTPLGGLASSSGIGGTVSVGACPTATLHLFNQNMVMDSHCAIWDSVKAQLTAVMHVVYVCMGILILLSA